VTDACITSSSPSSRAKALRATDTPLKLLVLNACDTLDGADVLLDVTPVVIAMSAGVSDLAAAVFAARFYAAIASAQSVDQTPSR
jgi:hypothetical protein